MSQSSRIIFFGNERLSTGFQPDGSPTLKRLVDNGYNVVAVVVSHHESTSRKQRGLAIKDFADQHGIPVLSPEKPADIVEDLQALKPDIGVLAAYGKIVPQTVIDIFPHGIVNIHPSLLPKYRGSTPIEQAILDGVNETGVSVMLLVKAMDAGPTFEQRKVSLNGNETKNELTKSLLDMGGEMLIKNLPGILNGQLQPTLQDESKATYCRILTKASGHLNTNEPATLLERQVRAFTEWPKSRIELMGQPIIVTRARIASSNDDGALVITCGENTFLEIQELVAPSGRKISGADFLRGYRK
jgi:methionyl-tRNA formyltransferase